MSYCPFIRDSRPTGHKFDYYKIAYNASGKYFAYLESLFELFNVFNVQCNFYFLFLSL